MTELLGDLLVYCRLGARLHDPTQVWLAEVFEGA
jgi:hypothetical protein